jgi:hypothetical protein
MAGRKSKHLLLFWEKKEKENTRKMKNLPFHSLGKKEYLQRIDAEYKQKVQVIEKDQVLTKTEKEKALQQLTRQYTIDKDAANHALFLS